MEGPAIVFDDVHKSFGDQVVLDGLSFAVEEHRSLVIMGPSGAGKSVILRHAIGLLHPDRGRVEVLGEDLAGLDEEGLRTLRRQMGYLFQYSALINWLDAFDNVALPLRETTDWDEERIRERVVEVLRLVQLEDAQRKYPSELSGGMQKRVGLARALVTHPRIILYDEPEAGLDPEMSASISQTMRRLKEELGMTSITVTHSLHCALTVGDDLALFEHGNFVVHGPPAEVLASDHPRVRAFFGPQIA